MALTASNAITYWVYQPCSELGEHHYEEVKDYQDYPTGFLYCVIHGNYVGRVVRGSV